jgi:putative transposase
VVYAEPPFGGPEYVLQYLGRYTHRMAISNHRLLCFARLPSNGLIERAQSSTPRSTTSPKRSPD